MKSEQGQQHSQDVPSAHHEAAPGKFTFDQMIDQLGDHHELNIFFGHYDILPIIVLDESYVPHVYANAHAMEAQGQYTMNNPAAHHKLVSTTKVDGTGKPLSPALDLSVTNLVAYQWIAILVLTIIFGVVRSRYKKSPLAAPRGIQNIMESVVVYVRDQIVEPNVGTKKRSIRLMPFMLGLFFFILTLNLISLLPGCHAATGALPVTMALATCTLIVINFVSIKDAGVLAWLKHLLGGAPAYISPIMVPIEIVGLITKPFALMIRLFANMTAGHIVLMSLVGLIFFFAQEMGEVVGWAVVPISVLFSVFIYLLELLVAFLQAYIFTMLTAVFVGLALGDHAKHDHHSEAH